MGVGDIDTWRYGRTVGVRGGVDECEVEDWVGVGVGS